MLKAIVSALLTALLGCEDPMPNQNSPTSEVNVEVGTLPNLISLPKQPTEVRWDVTERAQGQAATLRALLRFSEEDYAAVVEASETYDQRGNARIDKALYDAWIIPAAKVGIEAREKGSYYELVGVEPRKANLFWNAKLSPYVNGRITPLRAGYIFVSMQAN